MSEKQVKDSTADADVAPAAETTEASHPKKAVKSKKKRWSATHPSYMDMIIEAVINLGDKNGSTFQAIHKYIAENFDCDASQHKSHLAFVRTALKKGVTNGKLIQTKGTGASGSFKIGEVDETVVSKPTKRQIASAEAARKRAAIEKEAAKRAARRPKKKKHVSVQKVVAKKSVKKPAAKKATKAKPKKAKSGRKDRK